VSEEGAQRFVRMYEGPSGTPEQIIEWLKTYEEAGLAYAIINFADVAYDRSSLELFAREVMPEFA
ncbi:MAG TPA: LLM class F420-dependent oxidoreductase, partial [Acidimicrobiia bacterium]